MKLLKEIIFKRIYTRGDSESFCLLYFLKINDFAFTFL